MQGERKLAQASASAVESACDDEGANARPRDEGEGEVERLPAAARGPEHARSRLERHWRAEASAIPVHAIPVQNVHPWDLGISHKAVGFRTKSLLCGLRQLQLDPRSHGCIQNCTSRYSFSYPTGRQELEIRSFQ